MTADCNRLPANPGADSSAATPTTSSEGRPAWNGASSSATTQRNEQRSDCSHSGSIEASCNNTATNNAGGSAELYGTNSFSQGRPADGSAKVDQENEQSSNCEGAGEIKDSCNNYAVNNNNSDNRAMTFSTNGSGRLVQRRRQAGERAELQLLARRIDRELL